MQRITSFTTLEDLCEYIADETIPAQTRQDTINSILNNIGLPMDTENDIRDCLRELGFDFWILMYSQAHLHQQGQD